MSERAFKGVWIPAEIWLSNKLTIYEKAVFAEIDSLDGENHCWASNEYLAEFCKMSVPTISRAISKLIQLGYIEKLSFDGRQRVLAVNKNISQIRETYLTDKSEISPSENLLLIENKKDNIKDKAPVPGASSKIHSKIYKKMEVLEDKLQSGNDIAKQISSKKKSPKEKEQELCLDMIDKTVYNSDTKSLLTEYFMFVSTVPNDREAAKKVVRKASVWEKKLKTLYELSEGKDDVAQAIIEQSLKNQNYVFYPLQSVVKSSRKGGETLETTIITTDVEEAKRKYKEAIESGKGEFC